jgi:cytoskeletal protein CcmA (bactofilin family)
MRKSAVSRLLTFLLSVVVVLSVLPGVAVAESRAGGVVVVHENETVTGDLEAFAGSVVVRGTVTGDLDAFAGSVEVTGRVGGDVDAAAGDVEVGPNATVGGSLDAAAGNVLIAGTVDGDVSASGEVIRIAPGGSVGGDLQATGRSITLAAGSSVGGDVTYDGLLKRNPDAAVGGSITKTDLGGAVTDEPPFLPDWLTTGYGFAANFLLGALLLLAFPAFSRAATDRMIESPLRTTGVGLLALLAIPVVLVLLALTIVGIPLSVVGVVLLVFGAWTGAVYGRIAVGTWLVGLAGVENRWAALLAGLVALVIASRLPVVGGLVELGVVLLGVGALAVLLSRRYRGVEPDAQETPAESGDDTGPMSV